MGRVNLIKIWLGILQLIAHCPCVSVLPVADKEIGIAVSGDRQRMVVFGHADDISVPSVFYLSM